MRCKRTAFSVEPRPHFYPIQFSKIKFWWNYRKSNPNEDNAIVSCSHYIITPYFYFNFSNKKKPVGVIQQAFLLKCLLESGKDKESLSDGCTSPRSCYSYVVTEFAHCLLLLSFFSHFKLAYSQGLSPRHSQLYAGRTIIYATNTFLNYFIQVDIITFLINS